jgi:two-component system response regulator AgrA
MTLLTFKYKVEALDFIIKDGTDNVKRSIAECINLALERLIASDKGKTLRVNTEDKVVFVDMEDIIFIETTQIRHKLRLHAERRVLEFNGELKTIGEQLDERFVRCHRSCIINKDKIASINKADNTVTMNNNGNCPISRNGKRLLQV